MKYEDKDEINWQKRDNKIENLNSKIMVTCKDQSGLDERGFEIRR